MELSDEEKRQISEEEQHRLAQEQYRAQVRRQLQSQIEPPPPVPLKRTSVRSLLIVAGIVVLICAVALTLRYRSEAKSASKSSNVQSGGIQNLNRPSPLPPKKLITSQIADLATPWVVLVQNFNEDGQKMGQGSGYVFSVDGVVITNYHVVRGAKSLIVHLPGKGNVTADTLLGYSIDHDIAAVQLPVSVTGVHPSTTSSVVDTLASEGDAESKRKIQEFFANRADKQRRAAVNTSLPPNQPSQSEASTRALSTLQEPEVEVGDHVVTIGAPLGLENTVSEGIVSALRESNGVSIIQTTASISPGSSGGPLLNDYGQVIGLTTAFAKNGQNLNFAVSSKYIIELLNRGHPVPLTEMLNETRVIDTLPVSTISVPARSVAQLPFVVTGQQGAVLEGSYTITGGGGRDVQVALVGLGGSVIVNSGRVSGFGQLKQRLPLGQYAIIFDNRFSLFSAKSVSPDLKLLYYR